MSNSTTQKHLERKGNIKEKDQECVVIYKCRMCHVFYESMRTDDMIEHACKGMSKPVVGMGDIVCFVTLDGTEKDMYRIGSVASSEIYITDRMTR